MQQLSEAQLAEIIKKTTELRTKFLPVYKFLKKKQLKFKYARVGDERREYFRIDDFEKLAQDHFQQLKHLLKSERPIEEIKQQAVHFLCRPLNANNLKYPQILEPSRQPSQFATFSFNTEQSRKGLMFLIIAVILGLVLFPVWPYELKYAAWLVSLYLLLFMIGLILLRLVIYSVFSLLGMSVWLFPNLLGDAGVIDSFKPFISVERWETSKTTIILRLVILAIFISYGYDIYRDPSFITENIKITEEVVKDMHDWGVSKIKGETNFSQRALTGLADILNETADVANLTASSQAQTNTSESEQTL